MARKTADHAFANSQRLRADAQQKLASAKGHADASLENQAKELLAQERAKHTDANAAGLGGQTVVQAEDQLVSQPGGKWADSGTGGRSVSLAVRRYAF